MKYRKKIQISSPYGDRSIRVCQGDILEYTDTINLLTISAFERNYVPSNGTMIGALYRGKDISIEHLACEPRLDLRKFCGCWISKKLPETGQNPNIRRIGCIELNSTSHHTQISTETLLARIQSYFQVLDLLSLNNISVRHIVMPLLGTGNQHADPRMIAVPLISETLQYLRRSPSTDDITFIERREEKADIITDALSQSYAVWQEIQQERSIPKKSQYNVFISYSSADRPTADLLCRKLEEVGIEVWYAPRDIRSGSYASAIVGAISRCTHFITIISCNSMRSEHVLNEVDLAFEQMKRGIILLPFRIDCQDLRAEFNYYLKRQHWMEAQQPPMERRIEEFIKKVFL